MGRRERFFECIFRQDRSEYRFHVRAWDARQAEEHIRCSLRENGVQEPGTLIVLDPRGVELRQAAYAFDAS